MHPYTPQISSAATRRAHTATNDHHPDVPEHDPFPPVLLRLVETWRAEASLLRVRYEQAAIAAACEAHAEELERAVGALGHGVLTLRDAVRVSGYSSAHLRMLLQHGLLTNAGGRGRPRLLRSELPIKRENTRTAAGSRFDSDTAAAAALQRSSADLRQVAPCDGGADLQIRDGI